jgi:hypothetical protein
MPGPMQLPVFDGMAVEVGQNIAVLGGFTKELEATRAIQIRSPLDGWRPVGSALREPRARATVVPLPNRRVILLGGYSGTWGKDAAARDDGESLDPLVAGSGRDIEPFGASLEGHAASVLPDGRIAVSAGCALRLLDPTTERWSDPIELASERRHHASVLLGNMLVLIGGDELGTIETVEFRGDQAMPRQQVWESTLPRPLNHVSAIAIDQRRIFLAGGADGRTERTVSDTLLINMATKAIRPGPPLPFASGACDLILAQHPRGVLVLDGEWRAGAERGNVNAAHLVSGLSEGRFRHASGDSGEVWRLPSLGPAFDLARRMLVTTADGNVELLGGYRYRPPNAADSPTGEAGVVVDGSGQRLVVDALGSAD